MARKNRVSAYDGIYHITSRIANRAMLLEEGEVISQDGTAPNDTVD